MKNYIKLITSIVAPLVIGAIGAVFTRPAIDSWYTNLNKPFFSPPNYIFGPVWTILYVLMGISFYLVWRHGFKTKRSREAIYLFIMQLILNGIWSPVFFGLKNIFLALFIIIFLFIYIYKTIFAFKKIDQTAFFLLLPYLIWVGFASILNFSVWMLNR